MNFGSHSFEKFFNLSGFNMTFNQINYFLAVENQLSFTRAAAALFVTQSTLSRSISALETELGANLLERDFHNVNLTPAGELMYREMRGIMDTINGLVQRVQAVGDSDNGKLVNIPHNVGVSDLLMLCVLIF